MTSGVPEDISRQRSESDRLRKSLGAFGETYVCHHLRRQGYAIVDRNVRMKGGEIDIVARDQDELVFVEVKTRRPSRVTQPEDALSVERMSHLERAVDEYLETEGYRAHPYRIEIAAVEVGPSGRVTRCELFGDIGIR